MHEAQVRLQLERILAARRFANAEKLSLFLRYIVEATLRGEENELKETLIGVQVFGRKPDYDPKADSTVRVEAGKLRARLAEYYEAEGSGDPIVITIPKGSYRPEFRVARDRQRRPVWVPAIVLTAVLAVAAISLLSWAGRSEQPQPAPAAFLMLTPCDEGILLGVRPNGDLFYYRHRWKEDVRRMDNMGAPLKVGNGWSKFRQVSCAGNGNVLSFDRTGRILWYRTSLARGKNDWDVRSGSQIDNGWEGFNQVAVSPEGEVFGRRADGSMMLSTLAELDGTMGWPVYKAALPSFAGACKAIAASGQGVVYCLESSGKLNWVRYQRVGERYILDGRSSTVVAEDWGGCRQIASAPDGVLYCVTTQGHLKWNRRPILDPEAPWDKDSGTVSGMGFELPE